MQMLMNILYDCVYHSAPIILCTLGGVFAYKANVLNIALEGMMLNGAFVAVLAYYSTQSMMMALVLSIASTLLYGLVFSYFGITLKGNVIVIGLALNMAASAIAGFVLVLMKSSNIIIPDFNVNDFKINIPLLKDVPFLGEIVSGHPTITYVSFLLILVAYALMYKTKFGVYVRVVGENEEAAKSLGIRTNFYKYIAVLIGAVGCALAGMNLSLERMGIFTNNMTASRGFYCDRSDILRAGESSAVLPVCDSVRACAFAVRQSEHLRRRSFRFIRLHSLRCHDLCSVFRVVHET